MKVAIYYLTGNYGTVDTTIQAIQDGVLLDDAYLDAENLDTEGLVLTRACYTTSADGRQSMQRGTTTIATPEELQNIGLVTVDGQAFLKRIGEDDEFERCLVGTMAALGVGQDTDASDALDDEAENGECGVDLDETDGQPMADDVDV